MEMLYVIYLNLTMLAYDLLHVYLTLALIHVLTVLGVEVEDLRSHKNYHLIDHGDECGGSTQNRIIGGKDASLGQFPWLARLGIVKRRAKKPRMDYYCGGALINQRYVVTAAHCCTYPPPTEALLGEYRASTDPDCDLGVCAPPALKMMIDEVIMNNKYNSSDPSSANDICLLRLKKDVKYNDYVQPICLPVGNIVQTNLTDRIVTVAGWGYINSRVKIQADVLQLLSVRFISLDECQSRLPAKVRVGEGQVCAAPGKGQDTCQGDSGGPLVAPMSGEGLPKVYLLAVLSYGSKHCANDRMPFVNTHMAAQMLWILDNLQP